MKAISLSVISLCVLTACGGGSSGNDTNDNGSGNGGGTDNGGTSKPYELTVNAYTQNCNQRTAYADGEVLIHNNDGTIASRVALDGSGETKVGLDSAEVNFTVIGHEENAYGEMEATAKTFYAANADGNFYIRFFDYRNLPDNCSCEDADVELAQALPDYSEFEIASSDYYSSSRNRDSIYQSISKICGVQSDTIYAFHYDPYTNYLSWGTDNYDFGVQDTAHINFFEYASATSMQVSASEPNVNIRIGHADSESSMYFAYNLMSGESFAPVLSSLTQFDKQYLTASFGLASDPDNNIYQSVLHYQSRSLSLDPVHLAININPGTGTFTVNTEQLNYQAVVNNSNSFNAIESYLSLRTDYGYIQIYAPVNGNSVDLNLPQLPEEYGIDFQSGINFRFSQLREYNNISSYKDAIENRYAETFGDIVSTAILEYQY